MKTNYLLAMVLLLFHLGATAQFADDMEDYIDGDPVCQDWWTDWNGDCSTPLIASSAQALSGTLSAMIPGDGTTHAVLDLGNKIFGGWCFGFSMFIPSNKEATLSMQGNVPIGGGESVVGDIRFNPGLATPGQGYFEDTAIGQVAFSFPHDQWFGVYMEFDVTSGIPLVAWAVELDGTIVIPSGTPFTNEIGEYPTSVGGIAFKSATTDHLFYLDDIIFTDTFLGDCILSIEDYNTTLVTLSPNPAKEALVMISERATLQSATVYNLSGSRLQEISLSGSNTMDVRSLPNGIYFIEITSDLGKEVHRFVKQ